MDCLEFRRQVGAEPSATSAELEAHRRDCAACARHQDELRAMDAEIARALAIETARFTKQDLVPQPAKATKRRYYAIAASLATGFAVAVTLLISSPRSSLAREVIGHVATEPAALAGRVPIAPGALAGVLDPEGTRLRPGLGEVTFAARCLHDWHVVPHLVVRTPSGTVTVLLLRHREVRGPVEFSAQGFEGVVLPAPRGSMAVIGRDVPNLDAIARQVFEAVDWGV